tara:strand:+ start:379 stop:798 length:420 start_codon:yes stop_codon:yes gene_type:complete
MRNLHRSALLTTILISLVLSQHGCSLKNSDQSTAHIRFYTINKNKQLSELALINNRSQRGCQNFPLQFKLYRVAQVGFNNCTLYASKNCKVDSAIAMEWRGKKNNKESKNVGQTYLISPGALWYFINKDEKKVSSWYCG